MTAWRQIKRALVLCLKCVAYPLPSLVPRAKDQWVFGHDGGSFAGNPKYFFLWMTHNVPDIQVSWITANEGTYNSLKNHGYYVVWRWSLKGIWIALRSKVFVFDESVYDINFLFSRYALLVNLWHGVGLKTIGNQRGGAVEARKKSFAGLFAGRIRKAVAPRGKPDILVSTSDLMQMHFSEQCELRVEQCPQIGYPRLDCAADDGLYEAATALDQDTGFSLRPDGFSEIYLYLPTWRETGRPFFSDAFPDVELLSSVLADRKALLYVKPHPYTSDSVPETRNIRKWPAEVDFQPYLTQITGLVTDYSSVLYDYLFLTSGPAILYTFDYDQYVTSDRSLKYDYDSNVAGRRVSNFAELCELFRTGRSAETSPQSEVGRINESFWGGVTAPASPAIAAHIERCLENKR